MLGPSHSRDGGNDIEAERYLTSASRLIDTVFLTLGQPRSNNFPMTMRDDGNGYKGLRIGKLHSKIGNSDAGMKYDGMYWHYIDKFIFALCRYASSVSNSNEKQKVIQQATMLIKDVHSSFLVPNEGYLWKINVDLTRIPGVYVRESHDAVSAWAVFNVVQSIGGDVADEIQDLLPIAKRYFEQPLPVLMREILDPLGLGTHLWILQWLLAEPVSSIPRKRCSLFEKKMKDYRDKVLSLAVSVIENDLLMLSEGNSLLFRTCGALMSAQLVDGRQSEEAQTLSNFAERSAIHLAEKSIRSNPDRISDEHFAINSVMLASAVLPLAWKKEEAETFALVGSVVTSEVESSGSEK